MNEMIERVAKAMHQAADKRSRPAFRVVWQNCLPAYREILLSDARVAIEAMRNPTFDPDNVSYHEGMTRADWWRAMIDAALSPAGEK